MGQKLTNFLQGLLGALFSRVFSRVHGLSEQIRLRTPPLTFLCAGIVTYLDIRRHWVREPRFCRPDNNRSESPRSSVSDPL